MRYILLICSPLDGNGACGFWHSITLNEPARAEAAKEWIKAQGGHCIIIEDVIR